MPKRRRIVPDASVMVPAFFPEELHIRGRTFRLTQPALRLAAAITSREVAAFAPGLLLHEFLRRAYRKSSPRSGAASVPLEDVQTQVATFLRLPVTYVPMTQLADLAWDLVVNSGVPPPDAWYVACAMQYQAELWISHEHRDGLVAAARSVHSEVFLLTERAFGDRGRED